MKKIDTGIDIELIKLEDKVKEFQQYLVDNPIGIDVFGDLEDAQDRLHKEITIQIKMQDALFNWLPLLKRLKEDKRENEESTRKGFETKGIYNKK